MSLRRLSRRACLALLPTAPAGWPAPALARAGELDAPNVVPIGPRLVTAGQPTAAALATLGSLGFQAVVYLAPWTVPDAVADEPARLARQGVAFRHIPIPFDAPTAAHAQAVSEALTALAHQRVLVHCQVNMRASSMVFLHRVIQGREDPATAYAAVRQVWVPRGPWRQLLQAELARHHIDFELD